MHYLRIADDGEGVPRDADGAPDFRYVATHICDSLKRRLKTQGESGIQGEFGIGLLSFWTVGEELLMTCGGADGRVYQMHMRRNDPGFAVSARRSLIEHRGTELKIRPLLAGIRHFSGEKIQWYLAAELRDRIRSSGVHITVVDHQARREYKVEPREYAGRLLHELPSAAAERGELYLELYLNEADPANQVGLFRHGTRVLASIAELEEFAQPPWTNGCLQGLVDVPFLSLTPGTRAGLVRDRRGERPVDRVPDARGAGPGPGAGRGRPGRDRLLGRSPHHRRRHDRARGARTLRRPPGAARLHLRARARRAVALALRPRAQPNSPSDPVPQWRSR